MTYDRNNHVFLKVHNPSGQGVHFNIHKDGPHYHNTKKRHDTLVQTLSMNDAKYSKCQLKSVKLVREIDAKVGYLSQKDFKKLIKSNIIKNCPVNLDDTIRADKIYCPNIASLKVKTTQTKLDPVVTDYITVPKEINKAKKNIIISGYMILINNTPLFLTLLISLH